ncbi:MAG: toprim domain-containing protein [Inhella sp.]
MADAAQAFKAAILTHLGHAPEHIEPGKLHRFSTSGKRSDTAGWCKLFDDLRGGVFGCYRQGISESWSAHERQALDLPARAALARQIAQAIAERQQQQRQQWGENANGIAKLWAECQPLQLGDPGTMYLKRRGLGGLWPLPDCLRLHRGLPYWHEGRELGRFPAMVAPIVAPNGQTVALHRTYLSADGRKAEVPTAKKLTGAAGPLAGACIPLGQPQGGLIGIGEGIETALSAWAATGVPTVAAYCAHSLAGWQWPAGARRVVVFADHDRAGLEAADTLRARALRAGLRCEVHAPTDAGLDWADVWLSGQAPVIGAEVQP